MRKGILTMIVVLLLSATPCLAAELEFPQVDELWEQTERYGVEGGTELDEGLSNLFSDALSQGGELLRASVATGLKLLAVVVLCAAAQGLYSGGGGESLPVVEMGGPWPSPP